ncbi:hypothetical protein [Methylobacterium oxalidis]|uniref:hypothetical protein n=1 Tax=Methylobacterium oxalidis TaxID=944322 RepID=UPI0011BE0AF3|nr:hypothetical protein [Methylobacterium oxalidis]
MPIVVALLDDCSGAQRFAPQHQLFWYDTRQIARMQYVHVVQGLLGKLPHIGARLRGNRDLRMPRLHGLD